MHLQNNQNGQIQTRTEVTRQVMGNKVYAIIRVYTTDVDTGNEVCIWEEHRSTEMTVEQFKENALKQIEELRKRSQEDEDNLLNELRVLTEDPTLGVEPTPEPSVEPETSLGQLL